MSENRPSDSTDVRDSCHRTSMLRLLPDEPRHVEARAMLLRGDAEIFSTDSIPHPVETRRLPACVIRGIEQPLAVVIGSPATAVIRESVETVRSEVEVLCHESHRQAVAAALPSWHAEGAVFHLLPAESGLDDASPPAAIELRVLEPCDAALVKALANRLRREMQLALRISPVVAAMIDGRPASMAYSPAMTERWFDIAVETVQPYRRRGLAELVSRRLITMLMEHGLRPIWGAVDSNAASLALARKLGFVAHDRLALFTRPHSGGRHNRS